MITCVGSSPAAAAAEEARRDGRSAERFSGIFPDLGVSRFIREFFSSSFSSSVAPGVRTGRSGFSAPIISFGAGDVEQGRDRKGHYSIFRPTEEQLLVKASTKPI